MVEPGGDPLVSRSAQGAHPERLRERHEVEERLLAFEGHYEQTAAPFEWRFTRKDLTALRDRLSDKPGYPERLAA
jgi:hypothetical protein